MWREKWDAYEKGWEDLHQLARAEDEAKEDSEKKTIYLRNEIVWPVESGKRKDVSPDGILEFMVKTANSLAGTPDEETLRLLTNLKRERVRWHPDKVQHRFGNLQIDEGTLKGVTEVFQVMDRLYNERK
jgi:hypothetical protein